MGIGSGGEKRLDGEVVEEGFDIKKSLCEPIESGTFILVVIFYYFSTVVYLHLGFIFESGKCGG